MSNIFKEEKLCKCEETYKDGERNKRGEKFCGTCKRKVYKSFHESWGGTEFFSEMEEYNK